MTKDFKKILVLECDKGGKRIFPSYDNKKE